MVNIWTVVLVNVVIFLILVPFPILDLNVKQAPAPSVVSVPKQSPNLEFLEIPDGTFYYSKNYILHKSHFIEFGKILILSKRQYGRFFCTICPNMLINWTNPSIKSYCYLLLMVRNFYSRVNTLVKDWVVSFIKLHFMLKISNFFRNSMVQICQNIWHLVSPLRLSWKRYCASRTA